jgi:hypothetical protein
VSEVSKPTDPAAELSIDLKDPGVAAILAWLIPGLGHWYQGRRAKAVLYFVAIMGLFGWGVYLGGSGESFPADGRNVTIGYGRAVYFAWRADDRRFYYLAQVFVGLPALPALYQAHRMDEGNHRMDEANQMYEEAKRLEREASMEIEPKRSTKINEAKRLKEAVKAMGVRWGGFMAPPLPEIVARQYPNSPNADQPTADELNKHLHRYFDLATFYTTVAGLLNVLAIYDAWAGPVVVKPAKKDDDEEEDDGKGKDTSGKKED